MRNIFIRDNLSIYQVMQKLQKTAAKCLIVTDKKLIFKGTITDGDIRRYILQGKGINDTIKNVYRKKSITLLKNSYSFSKVKDLFLNKKVSIIPILDKDKKVLKYLSIKDLLLNNKKKFTNKINTSVVIMAGGQGSRLNPITHILPKPLIPINQTSLIEIIIKNFLKYKIDNFYFTINYKSKIIKAYFEELNPKYNFNFIEESKELGTAGGLKYLYNKIDKPFFVVNCDTIINFDYKEAYDFHLKNKNEITIISSMAKYRIPFGKCVLNDNGDFQKIVEKPEYNFLVNTGMYIINPDVLNLIPNNKKYDFTELIEKTKKLKKRIHLFPISEGAWTDVGELKQYKKIIREL